jgi:hypothetical protein
MDKTAKTTIAWRGELLWPQAVGDAMVIDLREVTAIGVWLHEWFRKHPNRAVVGGPARLKRQLQRAGVPVLWYDHMRDALASSGGVSASERDMLWNSA